MTKNTLLLILTLLVFNASGFSQKKVAPPWPGVPYTKVKAVVYNLDNQLINEYQIVKNNTLNFTAVLPGKDLNAEEQKKLTALLNGDTRLLNEGLSKCYEPHHAFVFYNDKDSIVAATDICFLCEGIRFYPAKNYTRPLKADAKISKSQLKATTAILDGLKNMVTGTGLPLYTQQEEYMKYGRTLTKFDTLVITNDTVFKNLIKPFSNFKSLLKNLSLDQEVKIDSSIYKLKGNKEVDYYIEDKHHVMLCTAYNNGALEIKGCGIGSPGSPIFKGLAVNQRKTEIYKRFSEAIGTYFYHPVLHIRSADDVLHLMITFSEKNLVEYIYYYIKHD